MLLYVKRLHVMPYGIDIWVSMLVVGLLQGICQGDERRELNTI